jgi:hypothetical protein
MPIASNAAEAVTLSRSQNIPLVVAVLSETGFSSERELLDACNFTEVVFLCAPFGSVDASNFGRMYPLPVTPIVYFILPSGKAVFVLKSSFSCSDIHDGIAKALSEMDRSPSPPPVAAPASSSPLHQPAAAPGPMQTLPALYNCNNFTEVSAADAPSLSQRKVSVARSSTRAVLR